MEEGVEGGCSTESGKPDWEVVVDVEVPSERAPDEARFTGTDTDPCRLDEAAPVAATDDCLFNATFFFLGGIRPGSSLPLRSCFRPAPTPLPVNSFKFELLMLHK